MSDPGDASAPNSAWLSRSRFKTTNDRNKQVRKDLETTFAARSDVGGREQVPVSSETQPILDALVAPLRREPPSASQAAELALTLAQFSLTEGRVLNIADPAAGDLGDGNRLTGDRTVSDFLCNMVLIPLGVQSTKGPMQSSSWRGGYLSKQVRDESLDVFARWQSEGGRTLEQVRELVVGIVDTMLDRAFQIPEWPRIAASRLTFANYLRLRERLLAQGSGGALEQYLLAGLMQAELAQGPSGRRVETKNVGANDRATNSPGDIVIREKQAPRVAFEVTAADWKSKVNQLAAAAQRGLTEATIVAPGVAGGPTAEQIAAEIEPAATRLGIDPAVVDLHAYMDILASRISPHGRAEALESVYKSLRQWHSRQPELVQRLISALHELDLVADGPATSLRRSGSIDIKATIQRVRRQLLEDGLEDHPQLPDALRSLAGDLEAEAGDPM